MHIFSFYKGCYITYSILSLGIQIFSLCRYDPHHNICGTTILWIFSACLICLWTNTPSFLTFMILGFFDIIASMLTHIPCHKSSSCWSLSSHPVFSLLPVPVYLLSSPFPLFVLHTYLHINLSLISTDLRFSPLFSDIQNFLTLIAFFWPVTFADIVSFFQRLNNVSPSFFSPTKRFFSTFLLFFQPALHLFFWRSNTLLAFSCFLCWLISIHPLSLKLFAWTNMYHHSHHTTSVHRDN